MYYECVTIALQSPVRSKPEEKKRSRYTFSLSKETYAQLAKASETSGDPMSRIIEQALRQFFGLTKQTNPDEKPPDRE